MREIPLTRGYVAIVDDDDYELVSRFKWQAGVRNHTVYAQRSFRGPDGRKTMQSLHRMLMNLTDPAIQIDHRDHDGLNNSRSNLRACSHAENQRNVRKRNGGSSRFKGTCRNEGKRKWIAQIVVNQKHIYLGCFSDELEAARVYDAAATQHFGEFANLNVRQEYRT